MRRTAPLIFAAALILLITASTIGARQRDHSSETPEGAVQAFYQHVGAHDWDGAYAMVAPASKIEKADFVRDVNGTNSSLKTISTLQQVEAKLLKSEDSSAEVRANLRWSTAVGAL